MVVYMLFEYAECSTGKQCRQLLYLSVTSPLQACPEGYRVGTNSSLCVSCDDPALMRDYLFLGFVCLVCVLVRLAIIVAANVGESGWPSKL